MYGLNHILFALFKVEVDDKDFEFMLINKLTKNYRKGARPVHSNREPVLIYYDLKVNKLEKLVSEKSLSLTCIFDLQKVCIHGTGTIELKV